MPPIFALVLSSLFNIPLQLPFLLLLAVYLTAQLIP